MTFDERVAIAKPYITGFVAGVVAAPIIAFSAGWVSTSSARDTAVENARITTLADVCAANVTRSIAAQNTDAASLKGYDNRDRRDAVVASAMGEIQPPEALTKKATSDCSRRFG